MDRFAVFVDAGYFFAAGGKAAFDITLRSRLNMSNPRKCVDDIIARAITVSENANLLRVYWYDGLTGTTPTTTQSTLAHLHGVKLRLGVVNRTGEQKGVDSLIVTDLIDLARNGAIADAILVAGDEDLRIAVQVAQAYGVRVHILAAGQPNQNVSPSLQMEADSVHALDDEWFRKQLTTSPGEPQILQGSTAPMLSNLGVSDAAEKVVAEILQNIDHATIAMLATLFARSTEVPGEYDRKLIACTARYAGRRLSSAENRQIRGIFITRIREKTGGGDQSRTGE